MNVRVSEFVREKLGSFEIGRAFYEFVQKEDLPSCRKIIKVHEAMVSITMFMVFQTGKLKYMLKNVTNIWTN